MHLQIAEVLGTVHMHEKGLFQGWRRPAGTNLVFYHMAAPLTEVMDSNA
jgi:hypothetical protein